LIAAVYQRGEFDAAATAAVYNTLRFFALGLAGHACLELAARAFFAQKDTVTPLIVAAGSAALSIALGAALMGRWGAGGLALGNSLAVTAEVVVLLALLRRRWGDIEGRRLGRTVLQALLASGAMAAAVAGTLALAGQAGLGALVQAALGGLVGVAVYLGAAVILRSDEIRTLPAVLLGRGASSDGSPSKAG